MGAWGTSVFDNDNAADFASEMDDCSTMQARTDLLAVTLQELIELDFSNKRNSLPLSGDYEFPYEVENALAAAAYVADRKNGREDFTNTPYAKIHHRKTNTWHIIPLDEPTPTLVNHALTAVEKVIQKMEADAVADEWQADARRVREALLA